MIELIIGQRRRDLGGSFEVGRVLPFAKRRMVSPFIFLDHMGPLDLAPGIDRSIDVRPHSHIGLSILTYLFAGEVMHRDSLGCEQAIRPHEANWMTAGSGITHSERFEYARVHGDHLHGIQAWVALLIWDHLPQSKPLRLLILALLAALVKGTVGYTLVYSFFTGNTALIGALSWSQFLLEFLTLGCLVGLCWDAFGRRRMLASGNSHDAFVALPKGKR